MVQLLTAFLILHDYVEYTSFAMMNKQSGFCLENCSRLAVNTIAVYFNSQLVLLLVL